MPKDRLTVGNSEWDVPTPPIGAVKNVFFKCTRCARPLFAGEIGSGTHIEVLCHYCNTKSQFLKP